jgi:hypothetical protein
MVRGGGAEYGSNRHRCRDALRSQANTAFTSIPENDEAPHVPAVMP